MKKLIPFAALTIFVLPAALPARAATDKLARSTSSPSPVPKKKHRFFDPAELSKDRSLPAGDKVPMTDDKPRKRESISDQLHKDRTNDGK